MQYVTGAVGVSWGIVFLVGVGAAIIATVLTPVIMFVMRLIRPLVAPDGVAPNRSYRATFVISLLNSFLTNLLFFILGALAVLYFSQPH